MSGSQTVSIAVIDDHPIVRQGLVAVLGREPGFEIIAEGETAGEAVTIAADCRPDIVVLDLHLPGGGIEALKQIRSNTPEVKCAILTVSDDAEVAIEALNAGACGYILKGVSSNDLKMALWTIVKNESFVSPEFATKLLQAAQVAGPRQGKDRLSYREEQILAGVEAGLTNRQIAEKLHLSEKTVKHYMTSIMQKYQVSNRVSAVVAAQKVRSKEEGPFAKDYGARAGALSLGQNG